MIAPVSEVPMQGPPIYPVDWVRQGQYVIRALPALNDKDRKLGSIVIYL